MSKVLLFDSISPEDTVENNTAKNDYEFLANTSKPEYIDVRRMLEDWFFRFPDLGKSDLKARFRSSNKIGFHSAFFELLLHELLLKLNTNVSLHKETKSDKSTLPDFFVVDSSSYESYVEATVITGKSKGKQAEEERLAELIRNLNRMIVSPNYWLALESQGYPSKSTSAKRIASAINKKLEDLDSDFILDSSIEHDFDSLPKWSFNANGCVLIFEPIPIGKTIKSTLEKRPIAFHSGSVEFVDHHSPIRNAVTRKANRYGKLSYPFIVAVNCLEFVDDIDVMNALFGQEQFHIPIQTGHKINPEDIGFSRKRDGAWTNPIGPRYTRISGVLIAMNLRPWSIKESKVCLYHNPWGTKAYDSVLTELNQSSLNGEKMQWFEGSSLADILEIESYNTTNVLTPAPPDSG